MGWSCMATRSSSDVTGIYQQTGRDAGGSQELSGMNYVRFLDKLEVYVCTGVF